jgi:hypothetical protein
MKLLLLSLLCLLALPVLAKKPPENGQLFAFEGTLNLDGLTATDGTTFHTDSGHEGGPGIKVTVPDANTGYPGLHFPIPQDGWDLTGYEGVSLEIANPFTEKEISVYLRLDNPAEDGAEPWNSEVVRVPANQAKTLKVPFGKNFGADGYKLDRSKVTAIKVFTERSAAEYAYLIRHLKAYGDAKAATGQDKSAKATTEGSGKPYLTETISPPNHHAPYGYEFELVKDWTFGKNRADATVRNRADLDKDFWYRYIYNNGTLDTLSTYWTVHRDYPEDDPRNLHVFTDNTLILKARVPEGGEFKKGGIESGMLRGKIPVTEGMYLEMRARMTRGIGSWPAFWLGCGVQHPDGTFSDLPWPPEIDILEFFNWQGRHHSRELVSNIQTNNNPKKFGNPYTIFTAFNAKGEYVPGMNFSEGFHVYALDWRKSRPIWVLDGHPIKQDYYEWAGPPAHVLVTNQLGIEFGDMKDFRNDPAQWDYEIDYIRIWKRPYEVR